MVYYRPGCPDKWRILVRRRSLWAVVSSYDGAYSVRRVITAVRGQTKRVRGQTKRVRDQTKRVRGQNQSQVIARARTSDSRAGGKIKSSDQSKYCILKFKILQ
jgi:hypothetical protein